MSRYDVIGQSYAQQRRADPRIAARLIAALGDAASVLNVGAGTGSYEPDDRTVVALDPSAVMIAQRRHQSAPAVRGRAETLPFGRKSFDAVMAVLTLHHWTDRAAGLKECVRVARQRVVLLTWDPDSERFWLIRDYLPSFGDADRKYFPPLAAYPTLFGDGRVTITPVPIARDCADGFLGAYWARPEAYLDAAVQAGMSSFAQPGAAPGLARLREDLASGTWQARYGHLLAAEDIDLGYRLVVADLQDQP